MLELCPVCNRRRRAGGGSLSLAAVVCAGALRRNVNGAVCRREARLGDRELGRGELVAVDAGTGEGEAALRVGVGEVRNTMVARTAGEGEQVLHLLRRRCR